MNYKELLKVLNKEKSYTEEDLLLFIYDLRKENSRLKDKIEKVVGYINDLSLDFYDYECEQLIVGKHIINELLEILKEN